MIVETGHYALVLALALALVNSVLPVWGSIARDQRLMAVAPPVALIGFGLVAYAYFALTMAHVVSDFSLLNVVENSHSAKPLIYKITGVWGNHEGSMLLWVLVLSLFAAAVALFSRSMPEDMRANVLAVQSWIAAAFILFILLTSNPFARIAGAPAGGTDLTPLLQDPGLAIHPPLLYLGYVGLSITYSFAAAALISGRIDAVFARFVRPWTLIAWISLTLGIAMGSYWAYYTLGWGGFWFWDPVENASLMPWLVCTALIHSMMATERTGAFKSWTLLLSLTAFSFSLIGTFLVRSGVLNSVHSFANDPRRGLFILMILFVAITAPLVLFAWRAPKLSPGAAFDLPSRETGILLNNLLLTAAAATILTGTLYPLVLDAAEGIKISVGPPYFSATVVPMFALLAVLMPLGPIFMWRRSDWRASLYKLRFAFAAAMVAMLLTLAVLRPDTVLGLLAVTLGVWLISGSISDIARRAGSFRKVRHLPAVAWTSALAHAGLGVVALGVVGATSWKSEAIQVLAPGQSMNVGGYALRLDATEQVQGPNYTADRAAITLMSNGRTITVVHSEKRSYPVEQMVTSQSSIRTTVVSDLYVVLGDSREGGGWVVRAYVNPMAPFIWLGAVVMAFAGFIALGARLAAKLRAARIAGGTVAEPAE